MKTKKNVITLILDYRFYDFFVASITKYQGPSLLENFGGDNFV